MQNTLSLLHGALQSPQWVQIFRANLLCYFLLLYFKFDTLGKSYFHLSSLPVTGKLYTEHSLLPRRLLLDQLKVLNVTKENNKIM